MNCSDQNLSTVDKLSEDLRQVLTDTHVFLRGWMEEADQALLVPQSPEAAMIGVRKRVREFEEEKRQWALRRERELQFIEEKAAMLADAWLNLEAEQRELVTPARLVREKCQPSDVVSKKSDNGEDSTAPPPASSLSNTLNKKTSRPTMTNDRIAQFQRLKQEVQSNPGKR